MTNEQKVKEFKQKLDRVFKTYFITELCADAVEVAVGIIAIILSLRADNQRALMLSVLCLFIVVFATSFFIIKLFFGSVSGMNKIVSFRTRFDFVSRNYDDTRKRVNKGNLTKDDLNIAKTIYDDEINTLYHEMENITTPK